MRVLLSRWMAALLVAFLAAPVGVRADEEVKREEPPSSKPVSGARLSVEKEVVDVGDVNRGQVATATFILHNTGDAVLKVLSAKPG